MENDDGLVSIKGKKGITIVEISSTYPTTVILALLLSVGTLLFLFIRYLVSRIMNAKNIETVTNV